jgi:Tfp pilus assembly protein PilF
MALYFPRSNALLLLVPKTGSTWIRAKVGELGLEVEYLGDPAMRDHDLLESYDRSRYRHIGAFVRDPLEWYRSYWAYRMERGWRPRYPLDEHCRSDDFETFIRNAVTILPGALGNIYWSYVGPPDDEIDFVGRQERLAEDFARFLRLIGEPVDEAMLHQGSPVNATSIQPDYPEELKELITLSEWDTMDRFGYRTHRPDPIGLAEMRRRYPDHADDLRLLALWTEKVHWAPDDVKRAAGRPVRPQTRHARAHSNFALLARHKYHDPDYAETRYRQALELDPLHPRTLCNYALFTWEHKREPQEARRLMLRALAGRPQHPYTLGKLARLTDRELRDPELAEVLYRQSLAGNGSQQQVLVELADLLARRGRPQDAVNLLREPADQSGASGLVLVALAAMLLRTGADLAEVRRYQSRVMAPAGAAAAPALTSSVPA